MIGRRGAIQIVRSLRQDLVSQFGSGGVELSLLEGVLLELEGTKAVTPDPDECVRRAREIASRARIGTHSM